MSERQYPCFVVCSHFCGHFEPALYFYLSPSEFFCIDVFPFSHGSLQISNNVFSRASFVPRARIYSDIPLTDAPEFLTVEYEQFKAADLAAMRQRGESGSSAKAETHAAGALARTAAGGAAHG